MCFVLEWLKGRYKLIRVTEYKMKIGDANSVIDYRSQSKRGAILRGGFRGGSP